MGFFNKFFDDFKCDLSINLDLVCNAPGEKRGESGFVEEFEDVLL